MGLPFEIINTHKIALAAKYGYDPNEVAEDGISDTGINVTIAAYDREQQPSAHASYELDSPYVHIQWVTAEQAEEARRAQLDDYYETLAQHGCTFDGETVTGPNGLRVRPPDSLLP